MTPDDSDSHQIPGQACPGCGSKEVIEVGFEKLMCQECYHVFENKAYREKIQRQQECELCPVCGKPKSTHHYKTCPYCLKRGIEEHSINGICPDCYAKYSKLADQSEDETLRKRMADELDEDEPRFGRLTTSRRESRMGFFLYLLLILLGLVVFLVRNRCL